MDEKTAAEFSRIAKAAALEQTGLTIGEIVAEVVGEEKAEEILAGLPDEYKDHEPNPAKSPYMLPNDFWGVGLEAGLTKQQLTDVFEKAKNTMWGITVAAVQTAKTELGLQ